MFCPNCKYEYKEGIKECFDCKVMLIEKLADKPQPEYVELVTVFASETIANLMVAKSLLQEAKIKYYAKGEFTARLFGEGSGTRCVQIQVEKKDAEDALDLLKDLQANK